MTIVKKISVVAVSAALAALVALTMAGCGEQVAGSWAHGKVLEDEITKTATEQMSYHTGSDGSIDVSAWTNYIADREYDSDSSAEDTTKKSDETRSIASTWSTRPSASRSSSTRSSSAASRSPMTRSTRLSRVSPPSTSLTTVVVTREPSRASSTATLA